MTIQEQTIATQSEMIRALQKENAELKKSMREQCNAFKGEISRLRNELCDAEAIILGNKLIACGSQVKKTFFVPVRDGK